MGRGGFRRGAGRKPSVKTVSNGTNAEDTEAKEAALINKLDINTYCISKLSPVAKKRYLISKESTKSPLASLKYNVSYIQDKLFFAREDEIALRMASEEDRKLARHYLQELTTEGTIKGKKIKEEDIKQEETRLRKKIKAPRLDKVSSSVTLLMGELRQYNDLIDKIESNRSDTQLNIFNLLDGKVGTPKQVKEISSALFDEEGFKNYKSDDDKAFVNIDLDELNT